MRSGDRVGIYFLETGTNQRPSKVVYDRAESSIANAEPADFDWRSIFATAKWLHITGITPALSQSAADLSMEAVKAAKDNGLTVSCDFNHPGKLWKSGEVGGGNSFSSALVYSLWIYRNRQEAIEFAVAASCLKHSIEGDFNRITVPEVRHLMDGDACGRVER